MTVLQTEWLLTRTFFGRFFESDLLPPGLPQVQLLIWGIAFLTAPGYLLSFVFAINYGAVPRAQLPDVVLGHQLLFVMFGMVALGAVALIIWEGVFPDRRDVRILGVLPLSSRTHVVARIGALGAVAGLFCIGVNLPSALIYGLTLWAHDVAAGALRAMAAHLIALSLGGVFTFFLLIVVQGIILTVFGRRTARRLAFLVQLLFVTVLLQAALFVPALGERVQAAFHGRSDTMVEFLPAAWFLALYSAMAGTSRPGPSGYALTAVGATAVTVILATALMAASYTRLARMALETAERHTPTRSRTLRRMSSAVASLVVRSPIEHAVSGFTLATLSRSRTHLTLLATYVGVGAALVLSALLPLIGKGGTGALAAPTATVLSVPLVLYFVVLGGLRVLVAIPTDIKANWAFRLYAPDDRLVETISGVRTAFVMSTVAPIAVAAGIVGVLLWGGRTGLTHGLFTGAAGLLLVDVLLLGLRKIPFTCTYYPGRSRARTMWPFYGLAFSVYAYSLAALEATLLDRPRLFIVVVAVVTVLVAGFAQLRRQNLHGPPGLTYEEQDPDGIFRGFQLSEGVAAERPGAHRSSPANVDQI